MRNTAGSAQKPRILIYRQLREKRGIGDGLGWRQMSSPGALARYGRLEMVCHPTALVVVGT